MRRRVAGFLGRLMWQERLVVEPNAPPFASVQGNRQSTIRQLALERELAFLKGYADGLKMEQLARSNAFSRQPA